jgi:hypothetical protein
MVAILAPSVLDSIKDLVELVLNPVKWVHLMAIIISIRSLRHHTTGSQNEPAYQHDCTNPPTPFSCPPVSHHTLLGEID